VLFSSFFENLEIIRENTLLLTFSIPVDTLMPRQFYAGSNPAHVFLEKGGTRVRLVFDGPFAPDTPFFLEWNNLYDQYGRRMPDFGIRFSIDRTPPQILTVSSGFFNKIYVDFSEPVLEGPVLNPTHFELRGMGNPETVQVNGHDKVVLSFDTLADKSTYQLIYRYIEDLSGNFRLSDTISFTYELPAIPRAGDVVINEILADPIPSAGLPEWEYVELWNVSEQTYSLGSMVFSDRDRTVFLPEIELGPGDFAVLGNKSAEALPEGLQVPGFPGLGNEGDSLVLATVYGQILDRVVYENTWYREPHKAAGGYSLERIQMGISCPEASYWRATNESKGGTPGKMNSVFRVQGDTVAPTIVSVGWQTNQHLSVLFDEPMDTLRPGTFFHMGQELDVFVHWLHESLALIQVNQVFQSGRMYSMGITGFSDCTGNVMNEQTMDWVRPADPQLFDLAITEIMADPEPQKGIAPVEYIEIHNTTDNWLSLQQVQLADQLGRSGYLHGNIAPHGYKVVTSTGSSSYFDSSFVSSVTGFPSLANDGETLWLWANGEAVSSVTYSSLWYDIATDGGISLEMIDPSRPCAGKENWRASISPQGGTPGRQNSVNAVVPDDSGPELTDVRVINADSLALYFSEILRPGNIPVLALDHGLRIDTAASLSLFSPYWIAQIHPPLTHHVSYTMYLSGALDCEGNPGIDQSFSFLWPEDPGDSLYINELLFDPLPGGSDFVELFNASGRYYRLDEVTVVSQSGQVEISGNSPLLIPPGEYRVLTEDKNRLLMDYPHARPETIWQVDQLPPMPNDRGVLALYTNTGRLLDSAVYEEGFHLDLLSRREGVSLERLSYDGFPLTAGFWFSASATSGFATPGEKNSQRLSVAQSPDPVWVSPRVILPGSAHASFSAFATIGYVFAQPGQFANVGIYDVSGRLVRQLARGTTLSTEGYLVWDGTDDGGNRVRMGQYLLLFEVFGTNGQQAVYRQVVTVGADY
ncbi:MAG: lamin tail domain-containing protein, partial [Cyclobacteriaceae bacterium]|nr:lamin tail domain-containing protein [Cyclobacteriaceae bacterium]